MSKVLVLNGSPRKEEGTVYTLLSAIAEGAQEKSEVKWIDLYDLALQPCRGCMKCRKSGVCILPADGAHAVANEIMKADSLVVGTPTYWGNMSGQLKLLFDRLVPVLMDESAGGMPIGRHKGKRAAIVTACTTPWPFNFIAAESRGAVNAVKEVLFYSGYKTVGTVVKPGTKMNKKISEKLIRKARKIGVKLR